MSGTPHWIDNSWNIQKRVTAFRVINEVDTTDNIYRLICGIIEEHGLKFKIFFNFF